MIKNYIRWFVGTYAYADVKEFLLSLCPSFKYGLQSLSLAISFITALVNQLVGIGPALAVAMLIAVIVETWSGIKASRIRLEAFESFKFSRCVIKVAVWYSLLYFTHSFALDCAIREGWIYLLGETFFNFVRILILSFFCVEYVTSILENLAVIDGKPKDTLIKVIRENWQEITNRLKSKKHE